MRAAYSEGGANHAQRRRFTNMELLLYGKEGVHLDHLSELNDMCRNLDERSASVVQCMWRLRKSMKDQHRRAVDGCEGRARRPLTIQQGGHAVEDSLRLSHPISPSATSSAKKSPTGPPSGASPTPDSPTSPGKGVTIDRSFLQSMSVGLPEMS